MPIFVLRANKYFTLTVVHVMCKSRERGGEGRHVIKGKGDTRRKIRIKPLLDTNLGVVQRATYMYSCTLVLWSFHRPVYFVSITNRTGEGTVKRARKPCRATCLQNCHKAS